MEKRFYHLIIMNCTLINIIWIERGILYTIIYYLIKYYDELINKIIIIDNKQYRKMLKILFPKLKIESYDINKTSNKYFYFNIRRIIKNQDIIIDYLRNYEYINTTKINLIPWYDMNDILVVYKYNPKYKKNIKEYTEFINEFSRCRRGNYNNMIWDMNMEIKILSRYIKFNKKLSNLDVFNFINNYIKSNYTNTVNNYYIPYQIDKIVYVNQPNIQTVVDPYNKIKNTTENLVTSNYTKDSIINDRIKTDKKVHVIQPNIQTVVDPYNKIKNTTENLVTSTYTKDSIIDDRIKTDKVHVIQPNTQTVVEPSNEIKNMKDTIKNLVTSNYTKDNIIDEMIEIMNQKIINLNNLII